MISYTISYVRRTMSYVKIQVLASRTCDVVYDVVYDVVCFLYDIVRATYDTNKKCTTSYVFNRFLPVVRATSHTTSYVFLRCRIRCAMQHRYYTISYVRFRCRWLTSPKTYNLRLPGAARKHNMREHDSKIWRAHAWSGALPLGIEPIVVPHQDGSYGCRWMGSRCRQRAPWYVTHTMSLEQPSHVDLVVEGHVLHSCEVLLQDGWTIGMLSERRRG